MKHFYLLIALLTTFSVSAQIPAGYYNSATGTGYTLKTQLKQIIDDTDDGLSNEYIVSDQGYNSLDVLYSTSDLDNFYENDGTILDLYSENPSGTDPYNFIYGTDQCGNYSGEGDCYNKEHVIPQSIFDDASPMRNDGHQVIPTDGRVNGFRGSYPYGVAGTLVSQSGITNPTLNGSKLGNNLNSGYSAGYTGIVFEPIDEFKGDIARIYFYFVTRYQNQVAGWSSYDMFDGSTDKVLADPFLNILMTWHQNDPVSQREIDRNNAVYNYQNNRNPFVDHPEYVQLIWDPTPDVTPPSTPTNLIVTNEASTSISLSWTASTDDVAVVSYDIFVDGIYNSNSTTTTTTVTNLTPETTYAFTVLAKDAANNMSPQSTSTEGTTTESGSSGSECAAESFTNIGADASTYTTVNWTGDNGLAWSATDARTDQQLNGKAITVRNGSILAPSTSGGIGSFTVTTQRVFSGSSGTFYLSVNGNVVATIDYSDTPQTITIPNINVENNVTVLIDGNSVASNRVMFDDLSWTCYSSLGMKEFDLATIKIYPNPTNGSLYIDLNNATETLVEIYSVLGKKVFQKSINSTENLQLNHLSAGVYILKLTQENNSISKKLIKN